MCPRDDIWLWEVRSVQRPSPTHTRQFGRIASCRRPFGAHPRPLSGESRADQWNQSGNSGFRGLTDPPHKVGVVSLAGGNRVADRVNAAGLIFNSQDWERRRVRVPLWRSSDIPCLVRTPKEPPPGCGWGDVLLF
jgi:hypothetical protein